MSLDNERLLEHDGLISADGYADTMRDTVLPALAACRKDTRLRSFDGNELFCSSFTGSGHNGTVAISHGFTECAEKYAELIYSLLQNGFDVLIWDQRGHGRSARDPEISDLSLTHIDSFETYVRDMEAITRGLLPDLPKPWRLFAHSMGGAIAALYLEAHADTFDKVVLSSPMIAPATKGVSPIKAKLICRVPIALGREKKRLFFSKPYNGPEDFAAAPSTCLERFQWSDALKASSPLFQNNGPTYRWLLESLNVTKSILAPGKVEAVQATVRVYQAELDASVLPEPQNIFVQRLQRGELIVVKGAKHEIFRSTDDVLFPWWHETLAFLRG